MKPLERNCCEYKLLIVEDEEIVRDYLVKNIHWNCAGIKTVYSSGNALEGIKTAKEMLPDIIITDIKMPDMTGLDMIKQIREFSPSVKTIILSGYNDFDFAREAIVLKAYTYLLKPFEDAELLEVVKKAITELESEKHSRKNAVLLKKHILHGINLKISDITNSIILDVRAFDASQAMLDIGKLFDIFRQNSEISTGIVKMVFERLISDIATAAAEIDRSTVESIDEAMVEKVLDSPDMPELKENFGKYACDVIALLKSKVYKDERIIEKVFEIIENEYMEGLYLGDLANRVYLSPNYLGQLFLRITGKTFNSYLTEFRMNKARELLKNSQLTLAAIAAKVGIKDETYFCTLFKSYFGMTPGKYRKTIILN